MKKIVICYPRWDQVGNFMDDVKAQLGVENHYIVSGLLDEARRRGSNYFSEEDIDKVVQALRSDESLLLRFNMFFRDGELVVYIDQFKNRQVVGEFKGIGMTVPNYLEVCDLPTSDERIEAILNLTLLEDVF